MTFEECDIIFELSITANQTREVLDLLCGRYFQRDKMNDIECGLFVRGYAQMDAVLSLVSNQVTYLAHSLNNLVDTTSISE